VTLPQYVVGDLMAWYQTDKFRVQANLNNVSDKHYFPTASSDYEIMGLMVTRRLRQGSIGGMLADQWKDFYTVPAGLPATAAVFAAVPPVAPMPDAARTPMRWLESSNIITNGSKIVVPEGYGLLLIQDGKITGFAAEAGGYEWRSDDLNSKSIFAGDGLVESLIKQSWERFKFGGQPGSQQAAFFVSLKELPDNRFGTQSEIYWDDGFLNTQVGAVTRGSYTLKIVDPILFVKNFVPASYLQPGQVFDFTDIDNAAASQLFNEVVGSLAPAFSLYTNDPGKGNRITKLQQDSIGFAKSLSDAVETPTSGNPIAAWRSSRPPSSPSNTTPTRANCSRPCSAPMHCPVRAAIPTCRPASRRACSRPAKTAARRA
jgi:membrane protease subunit (stomatin/prohibitin family)